VEQYLSSVSSSAHREALKSNRDDYYTYARTQHEAAQSQAFDEMALDPSHAREHPRADDAGDAGDAGDGNSHMDEAAAAAAAAHTADNAPPVDHTAVQY